MTTDKIGIELDIHASGQEVLAEVKRAVDGLARQMARITADARKLAVSTSGRAGSSNAGATSEAKAARDVASFNRQAVASLRQQLALQNRMAAQHQREVKAVRALKRASEDAESKAATRAALDEVRTFRRRMALTSALGRQAAQEEKLAARERARSVSAQIKADEKRTKESAAAIRNAAKLELAETRRVDRERATALRNQIAGHRWQLGLRDRMERQERREADRSRRDVVRYGSEAGRRSSDAYGRLTRPGTVAAVAGTAATAVAGRRILSSESDVDSAEIDARIYASLSKDQARDLRDKWAAPLAEQLGVSSAKLITSFTDAVKLGIPAEGAKQVAALSVQTSEAWGTSFESVSEVLGTINTILNSKGEAFDAIKLKSVANTLQHLAAKQSTTPEKMISFLQRGAGAAQILGMSQEAGLAFGSASTSLGNQSSESGRLFDYMASRIVELPRLVKKKGDEGKQAKELVRALGYGSANEMDQRRRADPDAFLPDMMQRFNKIKDQKKRDEALRFFAGREWLGELGRMVVGVNTYAEADTLQRESRGLDAIGEVWNLHKTKLAFVLKQIRAGFLNILGEFGKVLSPLAGQVATYFLDWARKLQGGGLKARFEAGIQGLIEGFGFKDLPALMQGVFGRPGEADAGGISTWKATAKAFAEGIRDVANAVKGVVGAFVGGDPEVIARWTGRILALSVALAALSPVLAVIGGLTSVISAVAGSVAGIAALKGLSAGAAVWTVAGGLIGTAFLATVANKLGILKAPDTSKGLGRGIVEFLDPGLASRLYGDSADSKGDSTPWIDPPAKKSIDTLKESIDANSLIHKQSYEAETGLKGLIRKAAYTSDAPAQGVRTAIEGLGGRLQTAALSGITATGGSSGGGGPLSSSIPGSALNGGSGLSRRGILSGGAGGSASSNPANSAASDAMLDAIAGTESGRASYDAVLGSGRYGTPSKPISSMSLDEAFSFGRQIKARHGSSSALGRYQIVGTTMRAAQKALGIDGSATFDASMQDRMARWIARSQGLGAWEGLKHNPRAMAAAREALNQGGAQDSTASSALGGGTGQYAGLRTKGSQAYGGGASHTGITDLARKVQENLPGGVKHFGAFNDRYHQGTGSKHAQGLAFDTTLLDPGKSREAAQAIRDKIKAAGLDASSFKVIDEYLNPSARSTGGHIHTQFNTQEAAKRYSDYTASLKKSSESIVGSGWKPALGNNAPVSAPLGTDAPMRQEKLTTPGKIGGANTGNSGGGAGDTIIHINGSGLDSHAIANAVQRHTRDRNNRRTHDLDPQSI